MLKLIGSCVAAIVIFLSNVPAMLRKFKEWRLEKRLKKAEEKLDKINTKKEAEKQREKIDDKVEKESVQNIIDKFNDSSF